MSATEYVTHGAAECSGVAIFQAVNFKAEDPLAGTTLKVMLLSNGGGVFLCQGEMLRLDISALLGFFSSFHVFLLLQFYPEQEQELAI